MTAKFLFIILICTLSCTNNYSQTKYYFSNDNNITKANGLDCNVVIHKRVFFSIYVATITEPNNKGYLSMQDISFDSNDLSKRSYYENFRIFNIDLQGDGIYRYWTIDIAQDGQTVLFEVDLNSAIPLIKMSRYAPGNRNVVLKKTVYTLN